jgi:hypothetical protein
VAGAAAFAHNFRFKIGNEQPAASNQKPVARKPETISKNTRNQPQEARKANEPTFPALLILLTGQRANLSQPC